MVNELKKQNGRPKGSGTGQQITARLRKEIYSALHITEKRGKPVDILIADQLEKDASGTISKLSKLLPQDVNVTGAGSEFALALQDVDIIEHFDFTSEPKEENVPKPKKKAGRPPKFLSKSR